MVPTEDVKSSIGEGLPSLEIALDLIREQLRAQKDQGTALDTKAGFMLASASVLVAAINAYKPAPALGAYPSILQSAAPYLPFLAIGVYLMVVFSSFSVFTLRRYQRAPKTRELFETYLPLAPSYTQGIVLRTLLAVYETNKRKLNP